VFQDKQAVEDYKADIKAQLTRKGLIRGQPRSSLLQAQAAAGATRSRPMNPHRYSAPPTTTTPSSQSNSPSLGLGLDFGFGINPYVDPHHLRHENLLYICRSVQFSLSSIVCSFLQRPTSQRSRSQLLLFRITPIINTSKPQPRTKRL
jgi:hypothetical protein